MVTTRRGYPVPYHQLEVLWRALPVVRHPPKSKIRSGCSCSSCSTWAEYHDCWTINSTTRSRASPLHPHLKWHTTFLVLIVCFVSLYFILFFVFCRFNKSDNGISKSAINMMMYSILSHRYPYYSKFPDSELEFSVNLRYFLNIF